MTWTVDRLVCVLVTKVEHNMDTVQVVGLCSGNKGGT